MGFGVEDNDGSVGTVKAEVGTLTLFQFLTIAMLNYECLFFIKSIYNFPFLTMLNQTDWLIQS